MRRFASLIAALMLTAPLPVQAQNNAPPHAWLFGAWIGGLYPPPSSVGAQECLGQPVVIFTKDIVMRAVITDTLYTQRLVETARANGQGVEFRFARSLPDSAPGPFGLPGGAPTDVGFGCSNPDVLRVQRISENQITFPGCSDFPYPLVRCSTR